MAKVAIYLCETPTTVLTPENRERQCTGKLRHRKRGAALQEARRLHAELKEPLAVYVCAFCRGWHVGKSARTILSHIRIVKEA